MMDALRSWMLSVTAAAILCALADCVMPQGGVRRAGRIVAVLVMAAAVLAPILPTMAVLGLALVGCACLLVDFMSDRGRELFYAPVNRYIWLYAAIYAVGTLFSVTLKGSLLGGVLTVAFILFAIALENAITTQRQLEVLLFFMVAAGAAVALYGICQYLFGWGYQSSAWLYQK